MTNDNLARVLIDRGERDVKALVDAYDLVRAIERDGAVDVADAKGLTSDTVYLPQNFDTAHELSKELRTAAARCVKRSGGEDALDIYKRTLLFDAPYDFDCAIRYAEWNREPKKRFYEPRRKQLFPIVKQMQRLADDELDLLAISTPPGVGKALADDTPILTRGGWKNHGDIVVGDEVIGLDGEFKRVIRVRPKCQLDVLVEFINGERIVCHENHEWLVYDRSAHKERLCETRYIEGRQLYGGGSEQKRGHRYVFQIPVRPVVCGEHKELFDPYALGVWLGDGNGCNPTICNAKSDYAIIEKIVQRGNPIAWQTEHKVTGIMYYGFSFRKELRKYDMCHSGRRLPKHIPEEYLTASVEQRLQLLAGLIDTDGTLYGAKYQYTTNEPSLRDSVCELISTFGWRVCVTTHQPCVSSSGVKAKKEWYIIQFTPNMKIPCALERKANKEVRPQRRLAIRSISRVEPKQGNCITVEGDGMYLAGRSLIPTHNTGLGLMFVTWISLRDPMLSSLLGSHSNSILRGMYDEMMRHIEHKGEYLWEDIFPKVKLVGQNAKDLMIDYGVRKRFTTIEMTSLGASNSGRLRASNLLYCDDLIPGLETALSADRLDKVWQQYSVDLRQRKMGTAKELHIATRWSVHDVIGRLEEMYEGNSRAEFIKLPALDEHDESNFDYPYNLGFSTEFYRNQREVMDDVSWHCLFMNEPIERDGLLYNADELRRYFELPSVEPDAVIAVCDTKNAGPDYCVMPIAYQYGSDFYIEQIICDNSTPDIVEPKIVNALVKHNVKLARFESNNAGGRVAESVQKAVQAAGGVTHITTKWNQANKETRIIVDSSWVKGHCLFKDETMYDKEYRLAMKQLCGFTMSGKNKHDDTPDAFSMLADFAQGYAGTKVQIVKRWF